MSFNRSTYSIVVGVISASIYLGVFIFLIDVLVRLSQQEESQLVPIRILVFLILGCCLMIAFSVLLIVGVVKRRHKFMAPLSNIYSFVCLLTLGFVAVQFFGETFSGYPMDSAFLHLFLGLLAFGVEVSVIYPILTLHRDIKANVLVNV